MELIRNVIPNLIGNLPYKKGDSRCIGNDSVNDSLSKRLVISSPVILTAKEPKNKTLKSLHAFCHSGLRAGIALELVRNVIPNLIGNLILTKKAIPDVSGMTV